jgi:hypothetical protein
MANMRPIYPLYRTLEETRAAGLFKQERIIYHAANVGRNP